MLYKELKWWARGFEHPEIAPMTLDNVFDAFEDLSWEEIESTLGKNFSPCDYAETTCEGASFNIKRMVADVPDLNPLFDLCASSAWAMRKAAD